jgi:ubiquinone/menaquinone biosynthesis C-methylase UbiE
MQEISISVGGVKGSCPITVKYKNDDNFRTYFVRQLGTQVEVDTNGSVIISEELQNQLCEKLSGFLDFVLDNITLPKNATIIDIGAGNSLIDLGLSMTVESAKFILIDSSYSGQNYGSLHSKDFNTYNSWQMVYDAIELSELNRTNFVTNDTDYAFDEPADVILSSYSWGMHYPIDVYLEKTVNALKPGGYLILNPVLNINGYIDEIDKHLTRIVTEPEGHWMRGSHEWYLWAPHFKNLPESEPTAYRCIWQKPLS